jgi:hypothetical protein
VRRFAHAIPCIAAALAIAGCGGGGSVAGHDASVDDHDSFKCPMHVSDNGCGVLDSQVVLNRAAGEYLVVWRARYDDGPVGVYGRRYDARTGEPGGPPTRLFDVRELLGPLLVMFDPMSRQYVIARQGALYDPPRPRIEVRRFDEALRPAVPVRRFGRWRLATAVAEPAGRIALVGVEGEPEPFSETSGPATLRIETLDSRSHSIGVERRRGKEGQAHAAAAMNGTYDASHGDLRVAWFPGARPDRLPAARIESFPAPRADRTARALGRTGPPGRTTGLACNARRGDCLLVYSAGGVTAQRIEGLLVDARGRRTGRPFIVASGRVDDPRVEPSSDAYSVTWWSPAAVEATRVSEARVAGAGQVRITRRYDVQGYVDVGQLSSAGTRLIAWVQDRPKKSFQVSPDIPQELRARLVK